MFDAHPSSRDRVTAAQKIASPGIFHLSDPAHLLFDDYQALAAKATMHYYTDQIGLPAQKENLVPNEVLLKEHEVREAPFNACLRFFGGPPIIQSPFVIREKDLHEFGIDRDELTDRLKKSRAAVKPQVEQSKGVLEEFFKTDIKHMQALQADALTEAGIQFSPEDFQLPGSGAYSVPPETALMCKRQKELEARLSEFHAATQETLIAELRYLLQQSKQGESEDQKTRDQIITLVRTFEKVKQAAVELAC